MTCKRATGIERPFSAARGLGHRHPARQKKSDRGRRRRHGCLTRSGRRPLGLQRMSGRRRPLGL